MTPPIHGQVYAKEMAEAAGGVSADYAYGVALDTYLADRQVREGGALGSRSVLV